MADNDKLRFEHRAYISGRSRRVTDTGDGADVRSRTSCTGKNDPRDGNTFTHWKSEFEFVWRQTYQPTTSPSEIEFS